MKVILPQPLKQGDEIRIIAPSCSGGTIKKHVIKEAQKHLLDLGFKISFSKHLFKINRLQSSSIESRVADLHEAFADKSVKGILAVRGGYNANDLLDYIDWELIKKNPKVYCGFSDNTVLQNAIFKKTSLVTYSGPNLASFGNPNGLKFTSKSFMDNVSGNNLIAIPKTSAIKIINPGKNMGIILGGNLCTFNLLQGTQYMPNINGSILFLEDDFISKYDWWEFSRNLQSLINLPNFEKVKGIVIGQFDKRSMLPFWKIQEIIGSKPKLKNIPIVSGVSFGHIPRKLTFPIGGQATLNTKSKTFLTITK